MEREADLRVRGTDYYADLELPTTCSIDEIKKQYRKLALLYHPDRNAGREDEYVPKFQAIQTAHEILGDPTTKNKYDADRRKIGLYSSFRPSEPTMGNPYAANSNYPPPPRRTQPGTWQKPQAAAGGGATPSGADRFSNFPRGAAPTARKDATPDRSNMFKAWQNMNNAQDRQQQQPFASSHPPPAAQPAPPPGARPSQNRPRPPPRQDTQLPSEDEIRAGMNYRQAPPPFDGDRVDPKHTAWSAFQHNNPGKPGVQRSDTTRTPKKAGFDPNAPGSDERPAGGSSNYAHRHRSEDFGHAPRGQHMPPPPPRVPPSVSPLSPMSPSGSRPFGDPLRPFKSRPTDEHVPYAEGNRVRTPYSTFVGEKTELSSDGLRRSASTRDTTKLGPNGGVNGRARSTSPLARHVNSNGLSKEKDGSFVNYDDSDLDSDQGQSSDGLSPREGKQGRPGSGLHTDQPKNIPTPPSKRFNGSSNTSVPPPPPPDTGIDGSMEQPGMQQKNSKNMYAPHPSQPPTFQQPTSQDSPFNSQQWAEKMFGARASNKNFSRPQTERKTSVPRWAMPSSMNPATGDAVPVKRKTRQDSASDDSRSAIAESQAQAYGFFSSQLQHAYGDVPDTLDIDVFFKLASTALLGESSGHTLVDEQMGRTLQYYPTLAAAALSYRRIHADSWLRDPSFNFPINPDSFSPNTKSRSEENINTSFSPEGWTGTFKGTPDYFAPKVAAGIGRKPGSPSRRAKRQGSGLRSATTHSRVNSPTPTSEANVSAVPPLQASTPQFYDARQTAQDAAGSTFDKDQWERTFMKEAAWSWPPPPPIPPTSPTKSAASAKSRSTGRKPSRSNITGVADGRQPDQAAYGQSSGVAGVQQDIHQDVNEDVDAMDIDSTPPAQNDEPPTESEKTAKEARMYAVPPSAWRQQQQPIADGNRRTSNTAHHALHTSNGSVNLKTNLDDLANVAPLASQSASIPDGSNGLKNLADLSSTLPFKSQSSSTLPTQGLEPQTLQMPALPKAPLPPQRLSKASWQAYKTEFAAYLKACHSFQNTMLQHFAARERQDQARMASGTQWLEAIGDSTTAGGWGKYMQGIKEDEQVRETWLMGCERRAEACKGFQGVRERIKRAVEGGGLVDV